MKTSFKCGSEILSTDISYDDSRIMISYKNGKEI